MSSTCTKTVTETEDDVKVLYLDLRKRSNKNVEWDDTVVDNENLKKKSSKKCCIFQKNKEFGESSSESDTASAEEAKTKRKVKRQPKTPCGCPSEPPAAE
eukprot:Lankesteria_metandrocarpae@DN5169_c1_g1_i2.p1